MMRSILVLAAAAGTAAMIGARPLGSQEAGGDARDPRLAPGARVRLTLHPTEGMLPGPYRGTLQVAGGDSMLVLLEDGTVPQTLRWTAVHRLEVGRRHELNPLLRAGIVVLAATGGVIGGYEAARRTSSEECSSNKQGTITICGEDMSDAMGRFMALTVLGGVAAGGLAALATQPRDRWQHVAVPRRVSVQPRARNGVAVAFTW